MNKALFNAQIAQYAIPTTKGEDRVYLPNSIKCYLPFLNIEGNTYQADYQGKNLFDITKAELTGCEQQDNAIMSNATSVYVDIIVPPGKYTLSFDRNADFAIYLTDGKVANGYFGAIAASNTSVTFTFPASYDGYLRIKWFNAGNAISNIQLIYEDIMPSPTNPVDIINAGDNGSTVQIRGLNLAYASNNNRQLQYATVEYLDNNNFIIRANNKTTTSSKYAGYQIQVKPNTMYRVKAKITRIGYFAGNTQVLVLGEKNNYISGTSRFFTSETGEYNITVNSGDNTRLQPTFYMFGNVAVGEENDPELVIEEFMMTEGTADRSYEPYTILSTSIPSAIDDINLKFAKINNTADTLQIDGLYNTVKYIQKVGYGTLNPNNIVYYNNNGNSIYDTAALSAVENGAKGLSNRAQVAQVMTKDCIRLGAGTTFAYWIGILDTLGFTDGWADKSNPTTTEKTQAITNMKNWLTENPTYFEYELSTPIEHDITNTEFGQQLLDFLIERNYSTTIELSDNALPQLLTAKYLTHSYYKPFETQIIDNPPEMEVTASDLNMYTLTNDSGTELIIN